ncbi:hypothetical protein D9756_009549 [Leucocoprinus leucothites]|uniref:Uncharacterized protein n=1 Tax=Leucocoprinus leucothites TaxID=201217 RepID=A0A8H5CV55_9AGAR|nr:hypothetical protein D9756_009549 [Leucoagaricus leucothites]
MQSPIEESLAEFGRKYRTLFIIGEFECSGAPRAERLHGKGRLLLGDFVSGFYEILKATKSTVEVIQSLDLRAQNEIRITSQDEDTQRLCKTIWQELEQALANLRDTGGQKMEEFDRRMIKVIVNLSWLLAVIMLDLTNESFQYRDRDVTADVHKLIDRVNELALKETEDRPGSSEGTKGRIASMANSLRLAIRFSVEKTGNEISKTSPLDIAKTELKTAQEFFTMASEARSTIIQCSLDWSAVHRDIEDDHTAIIGEFLNEPIITPQLKVKIKREFTRLKEVLASSVQQMNSVYKDIDAQFGHGRGINERVNEFQRTVVQISNILKELLSAKKIVDKNQQETYLKEIYNLARISLDQLRMVERVFEEWIIYIRSRSTAPLPFIDDAFQLSTGTAESFEHRWVRSHARLDDILSTSKKRKQKKNDSEVLPITSSSEALRTLKELEQTLFAITGFSIRLPLDLLAYDRRPEDMPRVDSGLAIDPFAIAEQTAIKAYEVLKDEIAQLELFVDPTSD